MASTDFDPGTALGSSLDALNLIEQSTDGVEIVGASLNQDVDSGGALIDVIDVYWRIPLRGGTFTTRAPFVSNWPAIAFFYIGVKQAMVRGIYAGLASKDELPSGPIGQPIPTPGTALAV